MSRQKLKQLGLDLPLFPTTSVGSFPKPPELMSARAQLRKRRITPADLKRAEEKATRDWIGFQEKAGVDVLVDGEMYRGDMVAYFAETLTGFREGGLVRSYGNRYYHKPVIADDVTWRAPITVDWWKFSQALTKKPVKGMLTGPYTIMDWSFNEHYPDRRAACMALAQAIRQEVEALISAGCKIIQIDEPALSVRVAELPLVVEAMDAVTRELPAYFITHICYGAFEHVYPEILHLPVDNLDLDMALTARERHPKIKAAPFTKDISYGVSDVHSHIVEDEATVYERVKHALAVIPAAQLWVDPDCGLKTRTVEEAQDKMRVIVAAAQRARKELA